MSKVIIIMGVSGSGKSTIAKTLATKMGLPFYDADDFHPISNVNKMSEGIPLEDEDRWPWLESLQKEIKNWQKAKGAVLACSALKESYRKNLSSEGSRLIWVFLRGDYDLILERMQSRKGHFMQADMLRSQFDTLEVPDYGFHVDIAMTPAEIIKTITEKIKI